MLSSMVQTYLTFDRRSEDDSFVSLSKQFSEQEKTFESKMKQTKYTNILNTDIDKPHESDRVKR